jgi:hypothetical protein
VPRGAIDAQRPACGTVRANAALGRVGLHGSSGELRFRQVGGATVVSSDLDGDARADFKQESDSRVALTDADFQL